VSGLLVDGHDPRDFARAIGTVVAQPRLREELARGAHMHAAAFGWSATTAGLLASYSAAMANQESTRLLASRSS
jgi:D-inositol-3-phosphate glycosyltransferase